MNDVWLSVILPVYNERDVLGPLHERLVRVMAGLERPYEIVFVDDGSTDGSGEMLDAFHEANPSTKVAPPAPHTGCWHPGARVASGRREPAGWTLCALVRPPPAAPFSWPRPGSPPRRSA